MIRVTTIGTSVAFEAAHRQYLDPSKCGGLHGHNWIADIIIDGTELDELGYLTDFKNVKEVIGELDHTTILNILDPLMIHDERNKVIMVDGNPTCEVLAKLLSDTLFTRLNGKRNILQVTVTLWENDKSWARATS